MFGTKGHPKNKPPQGGAYRYVRHKKGGEVHHVPANDISPYNEKIGPTFWMRIRDHKNTPSWGRGGDEYRRKLKDVLDRKGFRKALEYDLKHTPQELIEKYKSGVDEMLAWASFLEQFTLLCKKKR